MTTIESFVNRLKKIGIEITLIGNYPWVYLDTVNGKKVQGLFQGNHGFTAFFIPVRADQKEHITDIGIVFKKIRQTLNGIPCKSPGCNGQLFFINRGEYDDCFYACTICNALYSPSYID